jgi:hypothetical protein
MTEITVKVQVVCVECDSRLVAGWDGQRLAVVPCAICLKAARIIAFDDGKKSAAASGQ